MERYDLTVEGMSCGGCEQNVEDAVTKLGDVNRVEADHESDTVEVVGDPDDRDRVRETIREAGYEPA